MKNVKRREERAKLKISKLQQTCKQLKKELKETRKELLSVHKENAKLKQQILKESKKKMDSRKRNIHNLERIRTAKTSKAKTQQQQTKQLSTTITNLTNTLTSKTEHIQKLKASIKESDEACCNMEEQLDDTNTQLLKANEHLERSNVLTVTKEGRKYTNDIRELYYNLITQRLPPSRIEATIKTIINTFAPHIDTTKLELPKATLASNMRSHELSTISAAHQATTLTEAKLCHLNTDSTTLNQKKVQGILANGMVLGVTKVTDGSAKAAFKEISLVLNNLKQVAVALSLPNAHKIGWKMVRSVMSDKASTQAALNKLISKAVEEEKAIDKELEQVDEEGRNEQDVHVEQNNEVSVLETFCGMHWE